MITKSQVLEAQQEWADGIVKIGSLKARPDYCEQFTNEFLDKLYAFELGDVLLKPTKASQEQFRPTKIKALSYFIAPQYCALPEDHGFALNPWTKVRFANQHIILETNRAIAMGNYFFTDLNGVETKVEYTFGYRLHHGMLKIDVHHSSLPYHPG